MCTKGCDKVTGQCLDDGQCKDGYPSGYNWRGTACQIVPDAMPGSSTWWKVDFGGNYRISRVIIYNSDTVVVEASQCPAIDMCARDRCGAAGSSELDCQVRGCCWDGDTWFSDISCYRKHEWRLNAFTLNVGNSSDIEDHSQGTRHNGAVAAGATVNESCTATGRYLSFRRSGSEDNHLTTLCELVVSGYRYVSCQHCPSTSTCNDVIGCDACAPGKQQPDCVRDCDDGNYGINCNESCGHCKEQSKCSITNENCPSGCEPWYILDTCKNYIGVLGFHSSIKPHIDDITSTSATVTWPKASNISTGLEGHYLYIVWLQAHGELEQNTARVGQGAGEQLIEAQITGLKVKTNYSLRVQPYRQLSYSVEREGGTSTEIVTFKNRCPGQRAAALGTGAWIGIPVGIFLLGIVPMAIILILRMHQSTGKTDSERQGTEMSTQNADALEDAQGYVIPHPIVSEEEEGVVEDASGYYNVATESSQQEGDNPYDVIQT
ncbi:hypothetical protein LSAT2_016312 [Lamellibrachia satsuma]|nr:hypothetical protein LSAT2_016312 [Lamellibrachia satsuma]